MCYNTSIMGVITIEVPQRVEKKYKLASKKEADEVIDKLDRMAKKKKYVDLSEVFGMWTDRKESAQEIARELRRKNNTRSKNG